MFQDFWKDFWPSFISDILSGAIFTFVITYLIDRFRRPKLEIVLSISTGTQNRRTLEFYCVNSGKVGLMTNEIQWHLYFDTFFKIKDQNWSISTYKGSSVYIVNGTNDLPCLPNSSCLLASIDVQTDGKNFEGEKPSFEVVNEAPFYYSLTTTRGEKSKLNFWHRDSDDDFMEDRSFIKRRVFKIEKVVV